MCLKFKKQMNVTSSVHSALSHTPEQNVLRTETVSLLTHWDLGIICLCNQSQGSIKVVRKKGKADSCFHSSGSHLHSCKKHDAVWLTQPTREGFFSMHESPRSKQWESEQDVALFLQRCIFSAFTSLSYCERIHRSLLFYSSSGSSLKQRFGWEAIPHMSFFPCAVTCWHIRAGEKIPSVIWCSTWCLWHWLSH